MKQELKNRLTTDLATEDKLFNFRPVFFAAIFLCLGILSAYHERYGSLWFARLAPLCVLLCFLPLGSPLKKRAAAFLLCSVTFFTGLSCFHTQVDRFENKDIVNTDCTVCGTVLQTSRGEYSTYLILTDVILDDERVEGRLIAYLPASFEEKIAVCDEVVLSGAVRSNSVINEDGSFNAYAVGENIRYKMSVDEGCSSGYRFELFGYLRSRLLETLHVGMDERTAAITFALLTGETSEIENDLLANMRIGGIAHVFAVSGLHIGCLFAFCLSFVGEKKGGSGLKRFLRFVFTAAILLFYGGVCGYTPSVVRAIVTCLVFYGASLLFMSTDFLNRLGFAAIVILVVAPSWLFEAGFVLSFAACLGIGLLARPIRETIERGYRKIERAVANKYSFPFKENDRNSPLSVYGRVRKACISFLSVTISAQLATAPIGLLYFGYFSFASLLLNCFFVPIVSASFAVLLLLVIVAIILPFLAKIVLLAPYAVWSGLLLIFDTVDFSKWCVEDFIPSIPFLICYYLSLTFLTDKWNISTRLRKRLFWLLFFACLLIATLTNIV